MRLVVPGSICGALVPLSQDARRSKSRPLLVISSVEFGARTGHAICVGLTTSPKPGFQLVAPRLVRGRLPRPDSTLNAEVVVTLGTASLGSPVAQVTPTCLAEVRRHVMVGMGLTTASERGGSGPG